MTTPATGLDQLTPALSLHLRNFSVSEPEGWRHLLQRAQIADAAGIDRLAVSDHVVFGDDLDAYGNPATGGVAGGRQPTGPDGHWLEPLTVLATIAGLTCHSRLATSILIAPLRRPVVLAKTCATLDVLSGGRLDLGVGVGWQRAEYEAAGLPFDGRGALLDTTLEVCRALWTDPVAAVHRPDLDFEGIHSMPKPLQPGGVPVWVSGRARRSVIDRIVRFGSGWIPWGDDATEPGPGIAAIRAALNSAGRDGDQLQVAGTLPVRTGADGTIDLDATMAGVAPLIELGITDFRANVSVPDDPSEAAAFLAALVAAFRIAVGRDPH